MLRFLLSAMSHAPGRALARRTGHMANAHHRARSARWKRHCRIEQGPPLLELTTSQSQIYTGRSVRDMRLDKYLKVSRIIKRRTVANEACDQGRVLLNGRVARASSDVKPGDTIEVRFGTRLLTVEVVTVQETVHKEEASEMYRLVSEERIEKESGED